jgi:tryptophan halogenase
VFHKLLQIDEQEFMRATAATFNLGISFENWGLKGDHYVHSFGRNGKPTWMCEFHNFWLRSLELGVQSEHGDYCLELQAAKAGKFGISQQVEVNYAYHFDASQYPNSCASFPKAGIKRVEARSRKSDKTRPPGSSNPWSCIRARSKATCSSIAPILADHRTNVEVRLRLVALVAVRQKAAVQPN